MTTLAQPSPLPPARPSPPTCEAFAPTGAALVSHPPPHPSCHPLAAPCRPTPGPVEPAHGDEQVKDLLWLLELMIELWVADNAVEEWSAQTAFVVDLQRAFQEDAWKNNAPALPALMMKCTCQIADAVATGTPLGRQVDLHPMDDNIFISAFRNLMNLDSPWFYFKLSDEGSNALEIFEFGWTFKGAEARWYFPQLIDAVITVIIEEYTTEI